MSGRNFLGMFVFLGGTLIGMLDLLLIGVTIFWWGNSEFPLTRPLAAVTLDAILGILAIIALALGWKLMIE